MQNFSEVELFFVDETVFVGYHWKKCYWIVEFQASNTCGELYKQIMEDIFSWLRHRPTNKLIIDQSKKSFFHPTDTAWAWQSWLPLLSKILGKNGKLAVILPSHQFPTINSSFRLPFLQNKVFTSRQEAESWLLH